MKTEIRTRCLQLAQAPVVFGGIDPQGSLSNFSSAKVEISDRAFSFSKEGSPLGITDPLVGSLHQIPLLAAPDKESLNRRTDLDPQAAWVPHTSLAPGRLLSPGTCARGGEFSDGCAGPLPTHLGPFGALRGGAIWSPLVGERKHRRPDSLAQTKQPAPLARWVFCAKVLAQQRP